MTFLTNPLPAVCSMPTPAATGGHRCLILAVGYVRGERLARVQFLRGWTATVLFDSLQYDWSRK